MAITETRLPRSAHAPAIARRLLDDAADWMAPERRSQAQLLVSELVTNAVRHGEGEITLGLVRRDETLKVCVRDEGDGRPRFRAPGEDGGWGLRIVDRFAQRWGVADGATRVWFELAG